MSHREDAGIGQVLFIVTLYAVMIAGWVMNIMTLWNTMDGPLTAKMIVRIAGIFVFPLGSILGYL